MRARIVLLLALAWLSACAKPDVSGNVLPSEAERTGLPWARVDVRLVRGTLDEQLAPLAAAHRAEVEAEAMKRVLESAKGERAKDTEAGAADKLAESAPTTARACLPIAEAALDDARRGFHNTLKDLAPRLAAIGITAAQPDRALDELRRAQKAKVAAEARRLRDEYLSTQLIQQSGTVLAAGSRMDRLCWTVHNQHDVAVRFRGLTVLYNGHELPPDVAEQLWRLPPRDQALRMPGSRGVNNDLLPPHGQYEACFYANRTAVPVDILNRYGLSTENPNRNGNWRVRWDDIDLVDADDEAGARGDRELADSLAAAFGGRLRALEDGLEESKLIAALQGSASIRGVAQAQAALLACHRAIERDKATRMLERVIAAIESGRSNDLAVQERLRPIVQKALRDPTRISRWITEANTRLDGVTVARQEQALGAGYRFEAVEPGQYTLLAASAMESERPRVWVIPLQIDGPVAQDLVAASGREVSLRETLTQVLMGANG